MDEYEVALAQLELAAKSMRDAAVKVAKVCTEQCIDAVATRRMFDAAEACRAYMLAALRAAPGLADVFVVPARS